jgi:hypothetical protein
MICFRHEGFAWFYGSLSGGCCLAGKFMTGFKSYHENWSEDIG